MRWLFYNNQGCSKILVFSLRYVRVCVFRAFCVLNRVVRTASTIIAPYARRRGCLSEHSPVSESRCFGMPFVAFSSEEEISDRPHMVRSPCQRSSRVRGYDQVTVSSAWQLWNYHMNNTNIIIECRVSQNRIMVLFRVMITLSQYPSKNSSKQVGNTVVIDKVLWN